MFLAIVLFVASPRFTCPQSRIHLHFCRNFHPCLRPSIVTRFSYFRCCLQRTGSWLGAHTRRILSFFQPCPPPLSSSTTTQVSARPGLPLADYPREGSIPSLRPGSSLACQYPPGLCPQLTLPAICLSSCLLGTNAGSVTLCCREGVATLSCACSSTVQLPPLIPVLWTGPSGNASVYDGMLWTA